MKTRTRGLVHQHTQGDKTYANIRGEGGACIADCGSRSDTTAQANAAHLVACWNACEGIGPGTVSDLVSALEDIAESDSPDTYDDAVCACLELVDIARAAIRTNRGQANENE